MNNVASTEAADIIKTKEMHAGECVLMFSGGRDSTLAAIKLHEINVRPVLVTVTSSHLFGYRAVEARLKELKAILPNETIHIEVVQPRDLRTNQEFYHRTCLPCQHAYVVVAAIIAKYRGINKVALGYAAYQGDWPEQTTLATSSLKRVLAEFDLELLLPAYDFRNKDEVKTLLQGYSLSTEALEQKCSRQVNNVVLDSKHLAQQIEGWEGAIRQSLTQLSEITLEMRMPRFIGSY